MKRILIIVFGILGIAGIAWVVTGGFGRTIESRIEAELVARGLPQPMAECMAGRMAKRLTVPQLRKLEKLRAEEGEADVPLTMPEFLERIRRVGDPEVLEVTATSAAVCAFGGL